MTLFKVQVSIHFYICMSLIIMNKTYNIIIYIILISSCFFERKKSTFIQTNKNFTTQTVSQTQHKFIHSLIHSLTQSFIHSFIHSFIYYSFFIHLILLQIEEERLATIERDNRILLRKMPYIILFCLFIHPSIHSSFIHLFIHSFYITA